ncbi:MAG: hypothetical protein EON58_05310 [Alphaproteobacteria bacterium]|nr:MAG: hypothetical protein EON58_05310 [Alphaproteobacteria bacterium]
MYDLRVYIDTPQTRVVRPELPVTVSGRDWDGRLQDTWINPVNHALSLLPAPLHPEWHTTNSGIYQRLGLADFGLAEGIDGWRTQATTIPGPSGKVRLVNGSPKSAITTFAFSANEGVAISFLSFNPGTKNAAVFFECGYSNIFGHTDGQAFRFWSGGEVEVWKAGQLVGTYKIGIKSGQSVANRYCDILIIPLPGGSVLVYSITGGDGFIHNFADLDPEDPDAIVTDPEKFWFNVPNGSVNVEVARLRYPSTGNAVSVPCSFGETPENGAALRAYTNPSIATGVSSGRVWGQGFGGSVTSLTLVKPNGSAFVANGSDRDCASKIVLSGGTHSPWIYGGRIAYAAVFGETDGSEEFDLTPYLDGPNPVTYTIPDEPKGVRFTFTVRNPDSIPVPDLRGMENRPVRVTNARAEFGEEGEFLGWGAPVTLLDGQTFPGKFTDGEHGDVQVLTIQCGDAIARMAWEAFSDRLPEDGMLLTHPEDPCAVREMYESVGVTDLYLSEDTQRVTEIAPDDCDKWNRLVDVGDTPDGELGALASDFATGTVWGMAPTLDGVVGMFVLPTHLPSTPALTLYRDVTPDVGYVYEAFDEQPLAIAANEVYVIGRDARTGQPIMAVWRDFPSQKVDTAPSARPENWVGGRRRMGVIDERFRSREVIEKVASTVGPRMSRRYWGCEWQSDWLMVEGTALPIWRGALVEIEGRGERRITSIDVTVHRLSNPDTGKGFFASAKYVGGTILDAGGASLEQVRANMVRRAAKKLTERKGASELRSFLPSSFYLVS